MILFTKAQACGNDFLVITEEAAGESDRGELARRLCARTTGVGADGVAFLRPSGRLSGQIRLYNADGSVAEISGNGTRTVAAWMAEVAGAGPGEVLCIETGAGTRLCTIDAVERAGGYRVQVTTGMGVPTLEEATVSLGDGARIAGVRVSMGNPHLVALADDERFTVAGRPWERAGAEICTHPDFPRQTNVEFLRISGPGEVEIRIFERGVGPTMSSGTGTSAAAAAAIARWGCRPPLRVLAPGGTQVVAWEGADRELLLTGPAALVARGEAWEG